MKLRPLFAALAVAAGSSVAALPTNLLQNGNFASSANWKTWIDSAHGDSASIVIANGVVTTTIKASDATNSGIQLYQTGLKVVSGTTYQISFQAQVTASRTVSIAVVHDGNADGIWKGYKYVDFPLVAGKQNCTVQFTADTSDDTAEFQFNLGKSLLPITIDSVQLVSLSGTLNVNATATPGGSVSATPSGPVDSGTVVMLTATPNTGYTFSGWSGDTTAPATATTLSVTAVKNWNIVANFIPNAGTNLLQNGDFTSTANWIPWIDSAHGDSALIVIANGVVTTAIKTTDSTKSGIQLYQTGLRVDSGATYQVSFQAFSTAARPFSIGVVHNGNADNKWSIKAYGYTDFTLSAVKQAYITKFTADTSDDKVEFQFNFGTSVLPVVLDSVVLTKVTATGLAGSAHPNASTPLQLHRTVGGLSWTLAHPLSQASELRVYGAEGRLVRRASIPAGAASGSLIGALPNGPLFVRLAGQTRSIALLP